MNINFYDVEEIFSDVDEETLELFTRKKFNINDLVKLRNLKKNLNKLDKEIDNKISLIFEKYIEDF
jgi:hypothetical protein